MDEFFNISSNFTHINLNDGVKVTRELNAYFSLAVILLGLVAYSIAFYVFIQKRFRTNACDVLILFLTITDFVYLINYFFQDTLRTLSDIYLNTGDSLTSQILLILNFVDRFDTACRLINYFYYCLRFISVYLLVGINFQPLIRIYKPFKKDHLTKKSALIFTFTIVCLALLFNMNYIFIFTLNYENENVYCDLADDFSSAYFYFKALFALITICIPFLLMLTANLLILKKMSKSANLNQDDLALLYNKENSILTYSIRSKSAEHHLIGRNPDVKIANQLNKRSKKCSSKIILSGSFVFIISNLPYFFIWLALLMKTSQIESIYNVESGFLFVVLQTFEIVYSLNVASLVFIYCISASKFL